MSRTLSAEMQAIATAKVVRPIYLIDMEFTSPVRLWSGHGTLTAPNGNTLITNGDFSSGLAGWTTFTLGTGTVTHVNNAVELQAGNFNNRSAVRQTFTTVANQTYRLYFNTTGTVRLLIRNMIGNLHFVNENVDAGAKFVDFTAPSTSTRVEIRRQMAGTITLDDVGVYQTEDYVGAGDLLKISEVQETSDLQANGASVTLTGVNTALVSIARDQDYQGKKMSIALGAMDDEANVILVPANLFTGFMDVMTITDSGTSSNITVTCENKLIAFEKSYIRRYTDADQRIEHPTDDGFEYVASIQEKEIVWGRPTPMTAGSREPVRTGRGR